MHVLVELNSCYHRAFFFAERGREMFQESTRRQDQIRFGQYVAGSDSGSRGTVPTTDHKLLCQFH